MTTGDDALSEEEFEGLSQTAERMEGEMGLQTRLILLVCGRLGLRPGELSHMKKYWISFHRKVIMRTTAFQAPPYKISWGGQITGLLRNILEYRVGRQRRL